MFRDTADHVKRCDTCQRTKVEQAGAAGLMGHRVVKGPWTVIATDIMGPFPKNRCREPTPKMANEYRLFRSRYAGLFRDIGRQHPAFWTELGNLVEGHVRRQYTTEGAQVREFPATREYGVQTERTWSVDQVLNEVFGREPIEITEASTQTPSKTMKTTGMHTLPVLQRTAETQTSPDHWAKGTVTLLPNQKT
ncbi:myb-like protein x protein, partial [Lasius niger]